MFLQGVNIEMLTPVHRDGAGNLCSESDGTVRVIEMASMLTGILTTDLFRKDGIWFVQKDRSCSRLESLDMMPGIYHNKRLERLYLEDRVLPGVPNHHDPGS